MGRTYYLSFRVSRIFFAAGLTFGLKKNFGSFLKAKFKRLVFPVLSFGILNILLSLPFKDVDIIERLKGILFQLPGRWDDMWFVACLFIMEIIYYPTERYIDSLWLKVIVILLLESLGIVWTITTDMPLPWHIVNALLFLPFLMAGKVLASNGMLKQWNRLLNCRSKLVILPMILYGLLVLVSNNWPIDVHLLIFGQPLIFIFSAILGLWCIVSLAMSTGKPVFRNLNSILYFIGANTIIYYGLQSKAISMFNGIFNKLSNQLSTDYNITCFLVLICVLLLLAAATIIINRWMPFMTGNFKFSKY